jgi:hypothetical protein
VDQRVESVVIDRLGQHGEEGAERCFRLDGVGRVGRHEDDRCILAGVLAVPVRSVPAEDQPSIDEMVKNAKAPADHLALAARYDKPAADAQSQATSHRTMANTYRGFAFPKGFGGQAAMVGHCETLAKTFDTQASEYKAMAEAHRQIAK